MKIRQFSLRKKLVLSALFCFMIPLIGNYYLTNYLTKDFMLEKAITSAEDSLKSVETNVSGIIEQMLDLSNIVLMNNEVQRHLVMNRDPRSQEQNPDFLLDYTRILNHLDDLFAQKDDLHITIMGRNGFTYTNYAFSDFNPVNLYDQSWFSNLDKLTTFSTYWVGLQDNYFGGSEAQKKSSHVLMIGRSFKTSTGNPLGYVILSVNESKVRKELSAYSDQEMMLLDDKGIIMSHPDPQKIGQEFPFQQYATDSHTLDINGEKYLFVQQPVIGNNWTIINLIPYSSALDKNNQILFNSFALQVVFFTLFCFLLTMLISAITKPVVNLSKFIAKINLGHLDIRTGIRGQNEVGQLGRAIDDMLDRIHSMIEQITLEQAKKRKAELEMLQAQINPHFMFNLLNSIRLSILIRGDQENAQLIGSLSSLLRMTINRDNELIPLKDEVETIQHYIRLMNFRHANQVQLNVKLEKNSADFVVPRFMIQPLIENAIIHGFHQYDGQIDIEARLIEELDRNYLLVSIIDYGVGMTSDKLNELIRKLDDEEERIHSHKKGFSGIGVKNVYQRLKLLYGENFIMDIQSEIDVGTTISLQLPQDNNEVEG
jgi:two-component system, sensor histidine kinase YesM